MKTIVAAAESFLMVLCLAAIAWAQDVIKLKSGQEIKGRVSQMTVRKVFYTDTSGKAGTLKGEDVADVVLGEPVPAQARANDAFSVANFDRAINLYNVALEELNQKKGRDLHRQYIYQNIAMAQKGKGLWGEALETLRRLRAECGDCRLRQDSYRKSLEIAHFRGNEAVEKVLQEMKGEPEPFGSEAEVELGKLKYGLMDYESAGSIFSRVASNPVAAQAATARLWQIRCLRAQKKNDDVEAACLKALADRSKAPPALIQAAGGYLGDALLRKAEKE